MKLALLTFHNAANYGAALQAYALQRFLSDSGYDCEYINYINQSRAHEYSMSWHIYDCLKRGKVTSAAAYLAGSPFMELRKLRFKKFYKQYLRTTSIVYHNSKEAEVLNDIYDKFIVGSDQVWNPVCNGYDSAFLLDFVKDNKKKVSYSPSFGVSEITDELKEDYRKNLSDFYALGVREQKGKELVKSLTGREAFVAIDPVMLLSKEQWLEVSEKNKKKEHYIFSYTNRDIQIADFFRTGYKLNGRKHYILSRYTRPKDFIDPSTRVKYCMSPQEFVTVIANADLVVTASFHCVAMSMLLNRPFMAVLTGDSGKDERIVNLLKATRLSDRILTNRTTKEMVNETIDWDMVNSRLEVAREMSVNYLKASIS